MQITHCPLTLTEREQTLRSPGQLAKWYYANINVRKVTHFSLCGGISMQCTKKTYVVKRGLHTQYKGLTLVRSLVQITGEEPG